MWMFLSLQRSCWAWWFYFSMWQLLLQDSKPRLLLHYLILHDLFYSLCFFKLDFNAIISSSNLLSSWPYSSSSWFKSLVISLRWSIDIFSLFYDSSFCAAMLASKHFFWYYRVSSILMTYSSWSLKFLMTFWYFLEPWTLSFYFINYFLDDLFSSLYFFRYSIALIIFSL